MHEEYKNAVCITLDTDWANDGIIDDVARMLIDYQIPATWFVTHASEALSRLRKHNDLFELGIHPNFLPDSTHGTDLESVLQHCLEIVPEAVSSRSHAVVQSGRLLQYLQSQTPIRNECSTFLPEMANVYPLNHPLPDGELMRIPFIWADDFELCKDKQDWSPYRVLQQPGLKVFMFHPIHIAINTPSLDFYELQKRDGSGLQAWHGYGVRSYFLSLCEAVKAGGFPVLRIAELNRA